MKILLFGMAKEAVGKSSIELQDTAGLHNVKELKERLKKEFPQFNQLPPMGIAVNTNYARDEDVVNAADEIVVIPPVSGG